MSTTPNLGLTKPDIDSTGWGADVNTNFDTLDAVITRNQDNIALNAFRIAAVGDLAKFNLEDGFVDEFEDQTGVDTSASTNESYNSTGKYYTPTSTPAWDLSGNTVAQYKCNDNAANTTVTDEEGTNGTASTNTSNLSVAGKINNAFDFESASSEYFNCNQTFQTTFQSAFSLAFWLKPDDGHPASDHYFAGARNTTGTDDAVLLVLLTTGQLFVMYTANDNSSIAITADAIFPDGATSWTHFVVTFNSSNIKIYVNNEEKSLDPSYPGDMSGVTMGDFETTFNFFVGARNDNGSPSGYLNGLLDDFRIMNKVTTQTEIDGLYNSGNGTEAQSGGTGVYNDMTLISNAVEAEAEPVSARFLCLMEGTGITVNTDIKAYINGARKPFFCKKSFLLSVSDFE